MFTIRRYFDWILEALQLKEAATPIQLAEHVQGVLDLGQGGWHRDEWSLSQNVHAQSSGAGVATVLAEASASTMVVRAASIIHTGGAAAGTVELRLADVYGNTLVLARVSIPNDGAAGNSDLLPGGPIVVPKGWTVRASYPATGVGESYTTSVEVQTVPYGYKPV